MPELKQARSPLSDQSLSVLLSLSDLSVQDFLRIKGAGGRTD
ncbi:MAG: hypothetical protein ACLP8S_06905 [Solirubrobacteraceae bacterium]